MEEDGKARTGRKNHCGLSVHVVRRVSGREACQGDTSDRMAMPARPLEQGMWQWRKYPWRVVNKDKDLICSIEGPWTFRKHL